VTRDASWSSPKPRTIAICNFKLFTIDKKKINLCFFLLSFFSAHKEIQLRVAATLRADELERELQAQGAPLQSALADLAQN
jgi:hypothetical protein